METLDLIQKLYHAEPGIRRQAALVIGMVEETAALAALEQRSREEPDPNIKQVVIWAGKRVQYANQQNFSTIDAIFDHYQIDRELNSGIDPEEAELLRHQVHIQPETRHNSALNNIRLGSTLTADQIKTGRLGQRSADKIAMLRIPPIQPTDTNIKLKIKQLMDGAAPQRQKNAAIALREINNPAALPYLALVYYRNENPDLQTLIERSGKILYWSVNYAAMDRNGRLKLEIINRVRKGMYAAKSLAPQPVQQPSVTDILNQAQERRKRNRKR